MYIANAGRTARVNGAALMYVSIRTYVPIYNADSRQDSHDDDDDDDDCDCDSDDDDDDDDVEG